MNRHFACHKIKHCSLFFFPHIIIHDFCCQAADLSVVLRPGSLSVEGSKYERDLKIGMPTTRASHGRQRHVLDVKE